jgi:hypothetical protein
MIFDNVIIPLKLTPKTMKKITLIITIFSILSCQKKQENKQETIANKDTIVSDVPLKVLSESDLAKKWLVEKIEENFKTPDGLIDSICTKSYATYKSDAIGVGYDGGLTQKVFEKKWKDKFDVKHAGTGTGFLISGQDWVKIKVNKCELSPLKLKEGYLFETTIEDFGATSKTIYKRDIKIVPSRNSFLISDVLEY